MQLKQMPRFAASCLLTLALPTAVLACSSAEIAAVIDATGDKLRSLSSNARPKIDAKVRELAKKRGWQAGEIPLKSQKVLIGPKTTGLDRRAAQLMTELDRLGDDSRATGSMCTRLDDAKSAAKELIKTNEARNAIWLARLDKALAGQPTQKKDHQKKLAAKPKPQPKSTRSAPAKPASSSVADAKPVTPPSPWSTHRLGPPTPPPTPRVAGPATPATYTASEIADAGRGFFGTISANLAGVIQYAIKNYGQPTGYILGTEGSGAFIAGLRYGKGQLVTKDGLRTTVHWQGPSLGYDVGLTGSRVMFLVYGIERHQDAFKRFIGIDGSAYVVGGAGITFLKRGKIIMAPIRTGVGLRIGANIGYIKFTSRPSLNPF